ncbi:uncharacterized protein V1516DRAFT_680813 [Lipomyces oligophaga]|uniref:uncharacterized protein n=1 Tax=Lipomyces oligophaga TaxID=45792 RepID=UPI0034CF7D7F
MATRQLVRSIKNVTNWYSHAQVLVRDATCNEDFGPFGCDLAEIASMTFDQACFVEIMSMLEKRLNDKGRNWRHVLKALIVLDYCVHIGSEEVVDWSRDNIYIFKTLKEFVYIDEVSRDCGEVIRQKSRDLLRLLYDDDRLHDERNNRDNVQMKITRYGTNFTSVSFSTSHRPRLRENDDDDTGLDFSDKDREVIRHAGPSSGFGSSRTSNSSSKAQYKEHLDRRSSRLSRSPSKMNRHHENSAKSKNDKEQELDALRSRFNSRAMAKKDQVSEQRKKNSIHYDTTNLDRTDSSIDTMRSAERQTTAPTTFGVVRVQPGPTFAQQQQLPKTPSTDVPSIISFQPGMISQTPTGYPISQYPPMTGIQQQPHPIVYQQTGFQPLNNSNTGIQCIQQSQFPTPFLHPQIPYQNQSPLALQPTGYITQMKGTPIQPQQAGQQHPLIPLY